MGESDSGTSDPGGRGGDSETGFGGGYGATYKGSLITRKQPSKKKLATSNG